MNGSVATTPIIEDAVEKRDALIVTFRVSNAVIVLSFKHFKKEQINIHNSRQYLFHAVSDTRVLHFWICTPHLVRLKLKPGFYQIHWMHDRDLFMTKYVSMILISPRRRTIKKLLKIIYVNFIIITSTQPADPPATICIPMCLSHMLVPGCLMFSFAIFLFFEVDLVISLFIKIQRK